MFCRGDQWSPADACGNGKPSGRIWNPPLRRRGRCSSSTREGSGCRKAGGRPMAAPTVSPWPPLRGGSARRRWGRELYGCPKYFGLWQSSLPPPLRGTALAEGGQRVKKHRLCYIENVGATIGRLPAWRSNALSGMAFLQGIRARASNARPYRSFSTVRPSPSGEGGPAGPDEGQVCHYCPLMGCNGKVGPHQSAGGAADSFPRGGSHSTRRV